MRQQQFVISMFSKLAICALLLTGASVRAEDKAANPTGTWTWSTPGRNGGPDRTNTLSLTVDGATLMGKLSAPGRGGAPTETKISDGTVSADAIAFNIVRERNGNSMTNKYSGKIAGDKITGKMEYNNRDGESQSRDWSATRSADAK